MYVFIDNKLSFTFASKTFYKTMLTHCILNEVFCGRTSPHINDKKI